MLISGMAILRQSLALVADAGWVPIYDLGWPLQILLLIFTEMLSDRLYW